MVGGETWYRPWDTCDAYTGSGAVIIVYIYHYLFVIICDAYIHT